MASQDNILTADQTIQLPESVVINPTTFTVVKGAVQLIDMHPDGRDYVG